MPTPTTRWLQPEDQWAGVWLAVLNTMICAAASYSLWSTSDRLCRALAVVMAGLIPVWWLLALATVVLYRVVKRDQDRRLTDDD